MERARRTYGEKKNTRFFFFFWESMKGRDNLEDMEAIRG